MDVKRRSWTSGGVMKWWGGDGDACMLSPVTDRKAFPHANPQEQAALHLSLTSCTLHGSDHDLLYLIGISLPLWFTLYTSYLLK